MNARRTRSPPNDLTGNRQMSETIPTTVPGTSAGDGQDDHDDEEDPEPGVDVPQHLLAHRAGVGGDPAPCLLQLRRVPLGLRPVVLVVVGHGPSVPRDARPVTG